MANHHGSIRFWGAETFANYCEPPKWISQDTLKHLGFFMGFMYAFYLPTFGPTCDSPTRCWKTFRSWSLWVWHLCVHMWRIYNYIYIYDYDYICISHLSFIYPWQMVLMVLTCSNQFNRIPAGQTPFWMANAMAQERWFTVFNIAIDSYSMLETR